MSGGCRCRFPSHCSVTNMISPSSTSFSPAQDDVGTRLLSHRTLNQHPQLRGYLCRFERLGVSQTWSLSSPGSGPAPCLLRIPYTRNELPPQPNQRPGSIRHLHILITSRDSFIYVSAGFHSPIETTKGGRYWHPHVWKFARFPSAVSGIQWR